VCVIPIVEIEKAIRRRTQKAQSGQPT